jgi:hypothetical protein
MGADDSFRAAGGHITSVPFGPFRLAALARFTRPATMLSLLLVVSFVGYLSFGWGWDERFPLRPWPVPWAAPPDAEGRVYRSVTWCGFWIGVALATT